MHSDTKPKPLLDAAFGVVLIGLMMAALQDGFGFGEIVAGPPAIFLGLYLQAWGILFLLSYRFSRHSYLLKFLMWLCEHHSNPRGAWTALLWGVFAIGMGLMPLLIGLGLASF
jgi:hypothetical protein